VGNARWAAPKERYGFPAEATGPIHAYVKRYKDYLKMASSLFDERDVRASCERAADCP
jgi:hypothetical protein